MIAVAIVEDIKDIREGLRLLIDTSNDFLCNEVYACAEEALKGVPESQPDVVLMDINMTPVDGLAATKAILSRHPEARIIAVTQYRDSSTHAAAMSLGVCAFLGKDDLMSLRLLIGQTGDGSAGG
jgi:DNA-binding NarL/FixJ family response regulator